MHLSAHSRRLFLSTLAAAPLPSLFARPSVSRLTLCGIPFTQIRNGRSNRRYLVIHGDETTARDVLSLHMNTHRGNALLVESPTRTVTPRRLKIDPNRLFTRDGSKRSLTRLNDVQAAAIEEELNWLDANRPQLLKAVLPPSGGLLLALHNNARGYSIADEIPISNRVHQPRPSTPNDFFLFSSPEDFAVAARGPYNAVLQSEPTGEDDGSLSRLCAARRIRYLNLECALGNPAEQAEMLAWIDSALP